MPNESQPFCPKCGGRMKLIRPYSGAVTQFEPFWGCTNFPDCSGSRSIDKDGKPEGNDLPKARTTK